MKIAIVAPSSAPYTVGGAEKLWWGLLHNINQLTPHQAELIKVPSPETNFWELMASYKAFSELDLSHFDRIISTKYPAWMVSHPQHDCYMQHKLRGLYDTYHFSGQPEGIDHTAISRNIQSLLTLLDATEPSRDMLPDVWGELQEARKNDAQEKSFLFPGPFTRKIVHFLDRIAFEKGAIKRFFAISENVANRKDYFPETIKPEVLYHPSDLPRFENNSSDTVFTVSRLDAPKRIGLLIDAFMQTNDDIEFRIAGTGPEQAELMRRAKSDSRIRFLGHISDEEIIKEYGKALYVPFIPYDEDYGLITIEAMKSGKPVLTTHDAGGVTEFVIEGESGLVVAPEASRLAEAMSKLHSNKAKTQVMGESALARVSNISWQNTLDILIKEEPVESPAPVFRPRQHWVVVVTFPIWPPQGGGQNRIYHLYKELACYHDVTIVGLTNCEEEAKDWFIAPNLREIRIPKSQQHQTEERQLEKLLAVSVGDIAAIEFYRSTPEFVQRLKEACASADVVIASHPYLYYAVRDVYCGELWYESHNVEFDMKSAILPDSEDGAIWLERTRQVEQACCLDSSKIMTCSFDDAFRLEVLYGEQGKKFCQVPNGVSIGDSEFILPSERDNIRTRLGINGQRTALFIGSWHGPNIQAVEWIKENATHVPEINFLIMGSVCQHPVCDQLSENIHKLGSLTEPEKRTIFNSVDVAINPMFSGSGTNLKMLDYAAAGIPILTTEFGNRGLPFDTRDVVQAELGDFMAVLVSLVFESHEKLDGMTKLAFSKASTFDWGLITERLIKSLDS